jgi:hypothetical protein
VTDRLPFAGVSQLLIDGNNLLHRTSGGAGPAQVRLLLARLRGKAPAGVTTTVMLDGHPAPGTGRSHLLTTGLQVRHAGDRSADDALIGLVRAEPAFARASLLVVSDDRALVERARSLGARTQRLAWLEALLQGPAGGAPARVGMGARPPKPIPTTPVQPDDDDERPAWQPGRGATRKKGNPRRQPRRRGERG